MIISRIINDIISSSWQDCMEAAHRDPQLSNRVSGIMRSEKFIPDQSQAYTVMNMQPSIGAGGSPVFKIVSTVSDCAINSSEKFCSSSTVAYKYAAPLCKGIHPLPVWNTHTLRACPGIYRVLRFAVIRAGTTCIRLLNTIFRTTHRKNLRPD